MRSWQRSPRARDLSPKTVSLCLSAGRELGAHLERTGGPDGPSGLRREHVEGLILELHAHQLQLTGPWRRLKPRHP